MFHNLLELLFHLNHLQPYVQAGLTTKFAVIQLYGITYYSQLLKVHSPFITFLLEAQLELLRIILLPYLANSRITVQRINSKMTNLKRRLKVILLVSKYV